MECLARKWSSKLSLEALRNHPSTVRKHSKASIEAVASSSPETPLRKFLTLGRFDVQGWVVKAHDKLLQSTRTRNALARKTDKVTKVLVQSDLLDAPEITTEEKRSALRFTVYK